MYQRNHVSTGVKMGILLQIIDSTKNLKTFSENESANLKQCSRKY